MTTKVPFAMLDAKIYDPCDYGADPTGVADSTAAIQAAINAAPDGGVVCFRPGTYKAPSQISISAKLQLTLTGSRGAVGVNTGTYFGNAPRQNDYKRATAKGATGSRPTLDTTQQGVQYLDTTLAAAGKLITWTGTAWVDATGTAV